MPSATFHVALLQVTALAILIGLGASAPVRVNRISTVNIYQNRSTHEADTAPLGSFVQEHYPELASSMKSSQRTNVLAYDETTLISSAQLARMSYCDESAIAQWSSGIPLDTTAAITAGKVPDSVFVHSNSSTDTQAYTAYFSATNSIMVSFRGSQSLTNWLYNLKFAKSKAYPHCNDCRVHSGFYQSWESVREQITSQVQQLLANHSGASIYVTGHSLGGALAVLCATHLALPESLPVTALYTFGAPRVGNSDFVKFYAQGTFESVRVTHYKDPVPHLPMMSLGFSHTPTEVWYNKDSSGYQICDGSGEDQSCSNSAALDSILYVSDHLTYINVTISSCTNSYS